MARHGYLVATVTALLALVAGTNAFSAPSLAGEEKQMFELD